MKKIYLFIMCFLITGILFSQQIPVYTQYYINPFIYNPGFTNQDDRINAFLIQNSLWSGIPGAPSTSAFTLESPLKRDKIGIGLHVFNDVTGITTRFGTEVALSYKIYSSESSRLCLGVSSGFLDSRIGFAQIVVRETNEQSLLNQSGRKTAINAALGSVYSWKKAELGFSVPQIMSNSISYIQINDSRTFYLLSRHYLFTAKYIFDINKKNNISTYPLLLLRAAPGAPFQYDLNAVLDWKQKYWIATTYKSEHAISINLGIRLKGLTIGYAYDVLNISSIAPYSGSSQEILIGYTFKIPTKEIKDDLEQLNRYDRILDSLANLADQRLDSIENEVNALMKKNEMQLDSMTDILESYKTVPFTTADGIRPEDIAVGSVFRLPNVNFETNSTHLNDKSLELLDELINFLSTNLSIKIDIHGHTDDVGSEKFNKELSVKRAISVYDYLVKKGIDKKRLNYKGFGKSSPLVSDTTDKARERNRRTEFVILEK